MIRSSSRPAGTHVLTAVAATALLWAGACNSSPSRPNPPVASLAEGTLDHIAVIVMENKEYDEVIGNPQAPFFNDLANRYAQADAMYAISHPSLPNYLALISGNTHGIDTDCTDCYLDAPNLVDQLESRGLSWRAYMEGMPEPCATEDAGQYVVKHNPFVYFDSIRNDPERCRNVVPLTELDRDLGSGDPLPPFLWISPGLCADTHDCGIDVGDDFLRRQVPALTAALGPRSAVIVTYDEGTTSAGCCDVAAGGRVATIVVGMGAARGVRSDTPMTLYSILRTVEENFGLPLLGDADCECTTDLAPLLKPRPNR
jgi:hypothetical protein